MPIMRAFNALLLLAGLFLLPVFPANAQEEQPAAQEQPFFQVNKARVSVTFKTCSSHDECILVETLCDQCCGYDAINSLFYADFEKVYDRTCRNYQKTAPVCECTNPKTVPVCENYICTLITPEEARTYGRR